MSSEGIDGRLARLETELAPFTEQFVRFQRAPGLALGVVHGDELVFARGYGTRNLDNPDPVTPHTLFHMASVTKPFVGTAVMQLHEAGKLDVDRPLVEYLPYFTLDDKRAASITIAQLLSHTSGMPDTDDYEWDKPVYDDGALERFVRSIAGEKLIADPGEKWAYSNIAYEVLGDLIAKVSGLTFEEYVHRNILQPLGMTTSSLLVKEADPALLASPHVDNADGGIEVSAVFPYNRMHAPSSTLCSSIVDMARWATANLNRGELDGHRILQSSSWERMTTPVMRVHAEMHDWVGLSWFLTKYQGHALVDHTGADTGFRSHLVLAPNDRLAIIAMANAHFVRLEAVTSAALQVLFG